jgi:HK97 family phage major capsid protein
MKDNKAIQRELVQKADMALADIAPGGLFNALQATKFYKVALEKTVLSKLVTVKMMSRNILEQPKMLWTGRVLYPGSVGTALPSAYRSKPSFDKVTLTANLFRAEVAMPEEMLEDQIETKSFKSSVQAMAAEKIGIDIEDILIKGDTSSADPTLAVMNGLLALVTTSTYNAGGARATPTLWRSMLDLMPSAFRGNGKPRFFASEQTVSDWDAWLEARADSLGAAALLGTTDTLKYRRKEIVEVPRMPEDLGVSSNEANAVYGDPKGVWLGFQRQLKVYSQFNPGSGTYQIFWNVRMGQQLEHEPTFVRGYGILAS